MKAGGEKRAERERMIINTGSRTDIPAFYSQWFFNRIREGYVMVRNPFQPTQVTRYRLDPEVVDCLTFCTKNPAPMLGRLGELAGFRQLWYVTITPYGREIEPFVPEKERVMDSLKRLSRVLGIRAVGWRYDPIFISETYSLEFHRRVFAEMAACLEGYVDNCVISFIDLYEKTKRNFSGVRAVQRQERLTIGREFAEIGRRRGIQIRSCCEGEELGRFGVDTSGCMSRRVVERAIGTTLDVPRQGPVREGCDCLLGSDIGCYHSCGHGCLYCYANFDQRTVRENMERHDPDSPFLIGGPRPEDVIREARQRSWIDGQLRFTW